MSKELNGQNNPQIPSDRADLTKLALSLVAALFAYWLFLRFEAIHLYRQWAQSTESPLDRYLRLGDVDYPSRAVFLLIEMLVLIWLFRPVSKLWGNGSKLQRPSPIQNVGVGIAGGLIGFAVMIPFLGGVRATPFISGLITHHSIGLKGILAILLIGLLMPIGSEFVFRGIVQGRLTEHMSPFAAIIVSATLGAYFWSLFHALFSMTVGLVCGTLFWWRRTLLPAVVAHAVMTVSAGFYVGSRTWW